MQRDIVVPRWTASSDKHGVPRPDAVHAMLHATYQVVIPGQVGEGQVVLFIGSPHPQALPEDEVEVLVHTFPDHPGREAVIFHEMPLGPTFRAYRQEHPP